MGRGADSNESLDLAPVTRLPADIWEGAVTVVVQKWEESERGWGVRPDGYSLHATDEDRLAYIKAYWDSMPDSPPDEYSRPSGSPYQAEIDSGTYGKLTEAGLGLRVYRGPYPGDGGPDGWVPLA